jgi:hypothetical protein
MIKVKHFKTEMETLQTNLQSEISGFCGSEYEGGCLLGCCTI